MDKGALYIVATPIGNLEDVTLRALRTLREVHMIACEDTRVTRKLLGKYNIQTKMIPFHQHSRDADVHRIVEWLEKGESVALVTDAGTPGVSDPGQKLIEQSRASDVKIVPIPGVSAVTALVSVAGAPMKEFYFFGFVPHKKGRETFFQKVAESDCPIVYYDSPHRLIKNLELLEKKCSNSFVVVGREMTKLYEEFLRGDVRNVLDILRKRNSIKGECSVITWK